MRLGLLCVLMLAASCGGKVERSPPSPPSKFPPGWPESGCPPAFEWRDGRCQVKEIYVPGGTFVMGRGYCAKAGALEEPPDYDCPLQDAPHEVTVAPFWVDATVETWATTTISIDPDCPGNQLECANLDMYTPVTGAFSTDGPDRECVEDRGGRHQLTEAQWEFIATWGGTRTYPWGEAEPTCELANIDTELCPPRFAWSQYPYTALAMSYPPSPEGIYDLIGNLGETVAPSPEAYTPTYTAVPIEDEATGKLIAVAVRGGAAGGPPKRFQAPFRGVHKGGGPHNEGAFRCARPAD